MTKESLTKFWRDENGGAMVEYALITSLIAIAGIAGVAALSDGIKSLFGVVAANFESVGPPQ